MTVYLVGAGPGDPGLITVRGASVLGRAQVVVHDRLADPALLDLVPHSAERVDVGKRPGSPVDQEGINTILIEAARKGQEVVRLKGGDPFVFGRGGEEAAALQEAGIDFEVVPGITSAVAVPAYAGVPLTYRGLSSSFFVVTGHSRHAVDREVDWETLARLGGTIVVLMGVAHRGEIASRLQAGGMAPTTPTLGVEWGTRRDQHSVRTTLGELGSAELRPPATIVIGAVAGLDLGWFERKPLFGWKVIVTRARDQASALADQLRSVGAQPTEFPVIEVCEPADRGKALRRAAKKVGAYEWVVFTSSNAVERFLDVLGDARELRDARIAAVGPGTATALAERGLVPDLVPESFVAEALVAVFPPPSGSRRVLWPRAASAREVLPSGLGGLGWEVDEVEAYRTRCTRPSSERLGSLAEATAITFTSASTVSGFLDAAGPGAVPPVVACIGPVTARAAEDRGLEVDAIASDHTVDGLVRALVQLAGEGSPRPEARPAT